MAVPFNILLQDAFSSSGMTKVAFARALGVSDPYIHALLSGSKRPTIRRLTGIREALTLDAVSFYRLLNALAQEDPDYRALVALIHEDPELTSLADHVDLEYFLHALVPLFSEFIEGYNKAQGHNGTVLVIDDVAPYRFEPWVGKIEARLKLANVGYGHSEGFQIFLGRPDSSGIGIGHSSPLLPPGERKRVRFHLPIGPAKNTETNFKAFAEMIGLVINRFKSIYRTPNRTQVRVRGSI